MADENQRLRAYRQIANAADDAARDRAEKELADRYGPVPEAVRNLLEYSALKYLAEKIGVEAIDRRHNVVSIKFHTATRVDPQRLMHIVSKTQGRAVHSGRGAAAAARRPDRRGRDPGVSGRQIKRTASIASTLRGGMD